MKKENVLAVLLATVGIMLFGTLAVSADAHAGIQSASGKSSVPTAIAEEEDCGSIRIQGIPGNFQEGKVQMRQDRIFKNNFLHQQEAEEEQEILL